MQLSNPWGLWQVLHAFWRDIRENPEWEWQLLELSIELQQQPLPQQELKARDWERIHWEVIAAESTSPNSSKTAPPLDKTSHHSNSSFFSAKDTATRKKSIQFSLCAMCSIWFYVTATYNLKNTLNSEQKHKKWDEKRQTVDDRCLCVVIMYVMAAAMINYLYHDCPSHNWHVSWKIWVKLIINILTWMRLFVKVLGSPIWQAVRRGCLSRRPPPPRAQKAQNLWTCFCSATTYKFIYGQLTFTNYS